MDVLIGVMHRDTENEYGVYGSGVTNLANACPEFDVIVGGHGHRSIPNMMINNVDVYKRQVVTVVGGGELVENPEKPCRNAGVLVSTGL